MNSALTRLLLFCALLSSCFPRILIAGPETEPVLEERRAFSKAIIPFVAAQSKSDPVSSEDLIALRNSMEVFWAQFPAADRGATLLSSYMALYSRANPTGEAREWASFQDSKSITAGSLARRKVHFLELAKAPLDFCFVSLQGDTVDIARLRGRVVLVDFWATWCQPCIALMPKLSALYARYHGQGLEIVGVSLDEAKDKEKLISYLERSQIPWPQYFDGRGHQAELAVKYAVYALPTLFVVGKDGRLSSIDPEEESLDSIIVDLLSVASKPNKSVDPTTTAVTPPAGQEPRHR